MIADAPGAPATESPPAGRPTIASASAAYDAKDWARCGDQFLGLAALRRDDAAETFYNAGCCFALGGMTDRAFESLENAIETGYSDIEHLLGDSDLTSLRADARWSTLVDLARSKGPSEPALRQELLAMVAADQAGRKAWVANQAEQAATQRLTEIDSRDTARMRQIVARHGWPGYKLVGRDGSHAAWLLVQHADRDRAFQKRCLAKLVRAVAAGDASGANLAYLHDRVAVAEHRKQRYGTQFAGGEPLPIEDEANVDARRAAVGLGTMAEYHEEMRAAYGPQREATR